MMKNLVIVTNKIEERNWWTTTRWLTAPQQKENPENPLMMMLTVDRTRVKWSHGQTTVDQMECPWLEAKGTEMIYPLIHFKPILLLQHTIKIFLSLFLRLLLLDVRHYSHLARLRSLFFLVYQLLQFCSLFPNHSDFPLVKFYGILGRCLHKVSGTILDEVHFLTLKWTTECTLLELARVPSI